MEEERKQSNEGRDRKTEINGWRIRVFTLTTRGGLSLYL